MPLTAYGYADDITIRVENSRSNDLFDYVEGLLQHNDNPPLRRARLQHLREIALRVREAQRTEAAQTAQPDSTE